MVDPSGQSPVIAITLGDAAGVGPEVARAALASGRLDAGFRYRLIGSLAEGLEIGHPSEDSARSALAALEEAAALARAGEVAAVVTGPIHKARMQAIGFPFPGQTEFFANRWQSRDFAMLLTGGGLTVALVTAHVPLSQVAGLLTEAEIIRVGRLFADFLRLRTGRAPRIAVAGFNPHAGEDGVLGSEEGRIIAPAVRRLAAESATTWIGPLSPDTVFNRAVSGEFDGVLCMYHDQGLIPLKLHAFDKGVNVTLGLPHVRTSPDHGTAFEIAGTGRARPDSMIAAINLAAELVRKRTAGPS